MGIIHRDIKLDNVMVKFDSAGEAILKIADFGLSKIVEAGKLAKESVGTMAYASPEILSGKPYTSKVDIWSLGVIYFIIATTKMPFDSSNEQKLRKMVGAGAYPLPASIRGSLVETLITRMMCVDPECRLNADDCIDIFMTL